MLLGHGSGGQLSGALGRLLVTVERYPELKSNANFLTLRSMLHGFAVLEVEGGSAGTAVAYVLICALVLSSRSVRTLRRVPASSA